MGFFDLFKKKDMGFIIDNDPVMKRLRNEVNEINNKYDNTEIALNDFETFKMLQDTDMMPNPFILTENIKIDWINQQIEKLKTEIDLNRNIVSEDVVSGLIKETTYNIINEKSYSLKTTLEIEFLKISSFSEAKEFNQAFNVFKKFKEEQLNNFNNEILILYKDIITRIFDDKILDFQKEVDEIYQSKAKQDNLEIEVVKKFQFERLKKFNESISNTRSYFKYFSIETRKNMLETLESYIKTARESISNMMIHMEYQSEIFARNKGSWGSDVAMKILNEEVWIKMNNEQLLSSRGKPTNVEKEQTVESTIETWIYGNKNTGNYFVLVDGEVTKIVDR